MTTVARFDAELLVHRTHSPMGCGAGVLVVEPAGRDRRDPRHGSRRIVRRCVLPRGHQLPHEADFDTNDLGKLRRAVSTDCGLALNDGAWIDWQASDTDPRCPACHGIVEDEQEVLL